MPPPQPWRCGLLGCSREADRCIVQPIGTKEDGWCIIQPADSRERRTSHTHLRLASVRASNACSYNHGQSEVLPSHIHAHRKIKSHPSRKTKINSSGNYSILFLNRHPWIAKICMIVVSRARHVSFISLVFSSHVCSSAH
jgi:hypothetical protein